MFSPDLVFVADLIFVHMIKLQFLSKFNVCLMWYPSYATLGGFGRVFLLEFVERFLFELLFQMLELVLYAVAVHSKLK